MQRWENDKRGRPSPFTPLLRAFIRLFVGRAAGVIAGIEIAVSGGDVSFRSISLRKSSNRPTVCSIEDTDCDKSSNFFDIVKYRFPWFQKQYPIFSTHDTISSMRETLFEKSGLTV